MRGLLKEPANQKIYLYVYLLIRLSCEILWKRSSQKNSQRSKIEERSEDSVTERSTGSIPAAIAK